ncbi:MAG TPA: DUF177 domain-containing protein [Myxococcales bacterium]|jgi:uncharacterized protein
MIVLLEEIREGGLSVDRELTQEFLEGVLNPDGEATGFKAQGPARLKAQFERVGDKLLLEGDATVGVLGPCRRCLADVAVQVPVHFELNLVAKPKKDEDEDEETEAEQEAHEGENTSGSDTADEETFEGRQIDLGAIAREQILLALPMDLLCKDECKGLCAVCGQDLNVKECGCQRKVADPRWAALKDIKLK